MTFPGKNPPRHARQAMREARKPPHSVKEGHMIINHNMSALFANRMVKLNEVD